MKRIYAIVLLLTFLLTGCSNEEIYQSTDISKYDEYIEVVTGNNASSFFPSLDTLDVMDAIDLSYVEKNGALVRFKTLKLTILVSETNYYEVRDYYLENYSYFEGTLLDSDNDEIIPNNEFQYNDYTFFVVNDEEFDYPKSFGMIGYSDESKEIFFLFYSDSDIDYITDIDHFLETSFLF